MYGAVEGSVEVYIPQYMIYIYNIYVCVWLCVVCRV
jgi:hypothetical protein